MPTINDLTGQRFGRLVVLGFEANNKHGKRLWNCVCDCGTTKTVCGSQLVNLKTKSCGCLRIEKGKDRFIDISGETYGRLLVMEFSHLDKHKSYFKCRCSCGNTIVVHSNSLRSGKTKSCGCLHDEVCAARGREQLTTHGLRNHALYRIWIGVKDRCNNPSSKDRRNYGGRGINVCDEWVKDFKAFYDWAMRAGWKPGLSIERNDPDGDYCPSNCTWIKFNDQGKNKRNTVRLFWNGKNISLSTLCDSYGLDHKRTYARIKRGWPIETAISIPCGGTRLGT